MGELDVEEVTPEAFARRFTSRFIEQQPDEWVGRLYGFLKGQEALWRKPRGTWDSGGPLRDKPFIRLQDGRHVAPFRSDDTPNAYLPCEGDTDYPVVKPDIVANEDARQFLKNLGLKEPSNVTEVVEKVLPKYAADPIDVEKLPAREHARDIEKILRALKAASQDEKNQLEKGLKETPFLRGTNFVTGQAAFRRPGDIYIRNAETELYFDGNPNTWFLADSYTEEQIKVFCALGVSETVRVRRRPSDRLANVKLPSDGRYTYIRGIRGFDPDCEIDGLEHALNSANARRSEYVWNNLLLVDPRLISGEVQLATRWDYEPHTVQARQSRAGKLARSTRWLPDREGTLREPGEISLADLPEAFQRSDDLSRALGMKAVVPDVLETLARAAGVTPDDIEYLRGNIDDFRQWRAARSKPDFPARQPVDAEGRSKRVAEQAKNARPKQYDPKTRGVRTSDDLQAEAKTYLRELYTNEKDQMICQACHDEMPFKLDDGKYYFEAVECVTDEDRELRENHLALCPICAAKYRYANGTDPVQIREALRDADGLEVQVVLACEPIQIRFVAVHFQDLRTVLEGAG
jgi:hypothetical protein